jgi:hypothetical protein
MLREADTFARNPIDVWRFYYFLSVTSKFVVTQIVGENKNNVRWSIFGCERELAKASNAADSDEQPRCCFGIEKQFHQRPFTILDWDSANHRRCLPALVDSETLILTAQEALDLSAPATLASFLRSHRTIATIRSFIGDPSEILGEVRMCLELLDAV